MSLTRRRAISARGTHKGYRAAMNETENLSSIDVRSRDYLARRRRNESGQFAPRGKAVRDDVVSGRVERELRRQFFEKAAAQNLSESEAVRDAIKRWVETSDSHSAWNEATWAYPSDYSGAAQSQAEAA